MDGLSGTRSFGSTFDFTAPADAGLDLLSRAREHMQNGQPQDALAACRGVLQSDPGNAEALNLAGVAAFQTGLAEEALEMLQTAAAFAPDNAEILTNLGNVLGAAGRADEAAAAYADALRSNPRYAEAAFNQGLLRESLGDIEEALASYEQAIENAPIHSGARLGRASALKSLRRLDAARAAYEDILRREPRLAAARTNLAAVLQELGDFEGAAACCREALKSQPDLVEAHYNLGIALQELGQFEEALSCYERVLQDQPENAAAALNIACGLQELERFEEAAQAYRRTLAIDPDFAKAHVNLADLHLQQGHPADALAVCDGFLAAHPGNTDLLACKALALWDLGEADEARRLADFDRFVRPVRIEAPGGFEELDAFNAALCAHVESHPTLSYAPQSHATRKGRHSGELLDRHKGPVAGLEAAIWHAVNAYKKEMGADPSHPFLAAPPANMTLSVWGVVMQSAGHQIPHIHPAAWLSGVYYARVPEVVSHRDGGKAGWIEFGKPPEHFHNAVAPQTHSVKPEPGMMVLFPSYFYHHTVPFETDETRVSIAFDLMPG